MEIQEMKVSNMFINQSEVKSIFAYFTLTIGALVMKAWKLKLKNGVYCVRAPYNQFTNRNGKIQKEPLIKVLDPKITETILKLALEEYDFLKGGNKHANFITCKNT